MFSAFTNSLKIPELRSRIFYTGALLFVARVGAQIPLPGIDPKPLHDFLAQQTNGAAGGILGMYNMFTGGALTKGAICALGIMPYISAQIIFQLMAAVVPAFSRLQQEGDVGRQKLTQYTRYATLLICLIQGGLLILALESHPGSLIPGFDINQYGPIVVVGKTQFFLTSVILMTAGTMLLMWLGEQITQRGIGNGVSLLITIGILAQIPQAIQALYHLFFRPVGAQTTLGLPLAVLMFVLFIGVTVGIIMVVQGQRKIPVQYAKRVVGNKVMGGQSSFLPLKVNYSGVMPVIFATSILLFPAQIMRADGSGVQDALPAQLFRGHRPGALALLRRRRAADPVFQLLLGLGDVQADPDRRRPEEVRRLCAGRAPGRADGPVPGLHHDPAHAGRSDLPHRPGGRCRACSPPRCTSTTGSPTSSGAPGC